MDWLSLFAISLSSLTAVIYTFFVAAKLRKLIGPWFLALGLWVMVVRRVTAAVLVSREWWEPSTTYTTMDKVVLPLFITCCFFVGSILLARSIALTRLGMAAHIQNLNDAISKSDAANTG